MKVLFLDIDGVLNHPGTTKRFGRFRGIDPENVEVLNQLFDVVPDLQIVISSIWRLTVSLPRTRALLTDAGFRYTQNVVDQTQEFPCKFSQVTRRGEEIQAWVAEHPNVTAFVILDDMPLGTDIEDHLVLTDGYVGLQTSDIEKALVILGEESQ